MASRSTRTKGDVATQTARGSPSSNAREPSQSPIKPQANEISTYIYVVLERLHAGFLSTMGAITGNWMPAKSEERLNREEILSYCSDCH